MKFKDYHLTPALLENLNQHRLVRPTDIQYKSIPCILKGEDVLAIAQTGTGKTAAFAIPTIQRLHEWKKKARRKDGIKCLIMVPTHELAKQIERVFNDLSKGTLVNSFAIHGGVPQDKQVSALQKNVDVLITTPGRMFDLRSQGHLQLHRVECLILDEADQMLDKGFIKDIEDVIQHLPKRRQTLFFSATIDKSIKRLAYSIIRKNAIRIQISPVDIVSRNVFHQVAFINMDDKRFFLERLFNEYNKSKILVFARTKVRVERISAAMNRVNIPSTTIHGDKEHSERSKAIQEFTEGKTRMLIATDVSARGIDIPGIDYVVNYDLPEQAEMYVHRIGRTGRGNQKGQAVSFCDDKERNVLSKIETYIGKKIPILKINTEDYQETVQITKDSKGINWMEMAKKAMEEEGNTKKRKKK